MFCKSLIEKGLAVFFCNVAMLLCELKLCYKVHSKGPNFPRWELGSMNKTLKFKGCEE